MEVQVNALKKYMDTLGINCSQFSKISNIALSTIYYIYHDKYTKVNRKTASRIVRNSNGQLTLKDFGFED